MVLKPVKGYVENIKKTRGFGYWLGTYGQIATPTLWASGVNRLPSWYTDPSHLDERDRWMGKRVLDCVGVDKYARWVAPDGSIDYLANKPTDFNEDMLYKEAIRLGLPTGEINTLPLIEGVNLGFPGHWGVLVFDNGQWVGWESRGGNWGVVQYPIGQRPGTTSQWKYWFLNPFVDYGGEMVICKRGDKDSVTGNKSVTALQTGLVKLDPVKYNMGAYGIDGSYGPTVAGCVAKFRLEVGISGSADVWDTILNNELIIKLSKLQTGVPQAQYDLVKRQLDAANIKVADLEKQITQKNAEIASLNIRLSNANAQISSLNAQVAGLTVQLTESNKKVAALTNELNVANAKLSNMESALAVEKQKVSELEIKLDLAVQTVQHKEAEMKNAADNIKELIAFSGKH